MAHKSKFHNSVNGTGREAMGESHGALCDKVLVADQQADDEDYSFLEDQPDQQPELVDSGDEGVDGHEDEEVEPMRRAASPVLPSAADIEEHRITHMPYRSWCSDCN